MSAQVIDFERPEPSTNVDQSEAQRFLRLLDPKARSFTFQTFHDKKPPTRRELARVIHSPAWLELLQLHADSAGVYVSVNETDGKGRTSENIIRVRAVWQNDDDGFEGTFPLTPSMIVESSPGRKQRYWLVSDEWPTDEQGRKDFATVIGRMVASYGNDKAAVDISRVLRVPGFLHRKGQPQLVRLIEVSGKRYTRAEIMAAFPPVERQQKTTSHTEWKPRGDEDARIREALNHINADDRDVWVQVGMAIKSHMGEAGRSMWDDWSRQSSKYDERDQEYTWRTFRRNDIGIGTLFHHAKQAGWQDTKRSKNEYAAWNKPGAPKQPHKEETKQDDQPKTDEDAEIARLARLSKVEYERERKTAAEKLGLRASILDRLVRDARPVDDTKEQGRPLTLPEPEAWAEAVDGAELLNDITSAISSHVILPATSADVLALWVVHTHAVEAFTITPRLAIMSPEKQCGKTTLLDVVTCLVWRPLPTANASMAGIFRAVEMARPTLLLDEADRFVTNNNDELLGILNSGHRLGGSVLRTVGDSNEPRMFSTFAPCAFALIGRLPDTLEDRSVAINLRRRTSSEAVTPFRLDRTGHLHTLAQKAARWAEDHLEALRASDPNVGDLFNRVADNWRPLLAIADLAGGDWPRRARAAADAAARRITENSIGVELLADIAAIFAERKTDRLSSGDLATALASIQGRPWAEWGKSGKPISQNALARLLKKFSADGDIPIAPETIRIGTGTPKGYLLSQFRDAFTRYLVATPSTQPQHRNTPTAAGTSTPFTTATPKNDVADGKCEKPLGRSDCCGVADEKGENGPVCAHCQAGPSTEPPTDAPTVELTQDGGQLVWLHRECVRFWRQDQGAA
jgi:uncharacterized protein DUF3631/primase-like protein/DNA primase RepB-like protein